MTAIRRLLLFVCAVAAGAACGSDSGRGATDAADTAVTDTAAPADTAPADVPDTDPAPDTATAGPLTVVGHVPASDATVGVASPITVTFSRAIDADSVSDATVALTTTTAVYYGELVVDGATLTLTPYDPLPSGTVLRVTIGADLAAADGALLGTPVTWAFQTLPAIHVTAVEPLAGAADVRAFDAIRVTFDAPIDRHSVTGDTIVVRTTGWVDGVHYDDAPIPAGDLRVIQPDGATGDEGTVIQWFPASTGFPEYGARVDVTVTRGVRSVAGAALAEPYVFGFTTSVLDPGYYYQLRVEGLGDGWLIGIDGVNPVMTQTASESTDWYVVPLNDGKSFGLWNRAAAQALTDPGPTAVLSVAPWAGQFGQAWTFISRSGRTGELGPNQSVSVYYIKNNLRGAEACLQTPPGAPGTALRMVPCGGNNILSLWYFTRSDRK
ncbi:MAG: Ig-like domain-containing protein [Deltaproteobacteria bacterium]|nr:Ig-like domain-containing protein [Deltaproteobacteria bacterium]